MMGNQGIQGGKDNDELSQSGIDLIMANVDTDEQEVRRWYRQFLKMAPDGRMDFETFDHFYRCCNPGLDTHAIAKIVFKHLDKTKSGYIDFYDFFITNNIYRQGDAKARAKLVFDFCDSDKNGSVSMRELSEMLEAMYNLKGIVGDQHVKSKAKEILKKIDINKDRKVQRSEFVYSMLMDKETADLLSFDFTFDIPRC